MSWSEWLNGILGLWVIVAAYAFVPSGTGQILLLITGAAVAILGFWGGATESHYGNHNRQMQ